MLVSSHNLCFYHAFTVFVPLLAFLANDADSVGTALIPAKALRVQGALLLTSRFCIREPAAQPRLTTDTGKKQSSFRY